MQSVLTLKKRVVSLSEVRGGGEVTIILTNGFALTDHGLSM